MNHNNTSPRYLDGLRSIPHPVRLSLTGKFLVIYKENEIIAKYAYEDLFVKEDWNDDVGGIFGFKNNTDAGLSVDLHKHYTAIQNRLSGRSKSSFIIPTQYRYLFLMLLGAIASGFLVFPLLNGVAGFAAAHLVPNKVEKKLGDIVLKDMASSFKPCEDKIVMGSLQKISDRLVLANKKGEIKPDLHLFHSSTANAFTLPGHKMAILSGFLADSRSENEIAAVLAHEMGHMETHDSLEAFIEAQGFTILGTLIGSGSYSNVAEFAAYMQTMRYSRKKEFAADEYGAKLLLKAGYSPVGLSDFLTRMDKKEKSVIGDTMSHLEFLSTHPETAERSKRIKEFSKNVGSHYKPSLSREEFIRLTQACSFSSLKSGKK